MIRDMDASIVKMLQKGITELLIEAIREDEQTINDSTIKEYVYVSLQDDFTLDFLKAIGLRHFDGNKEAQLIINDFIGVLKDMYDEGKIELYKED